VFPVFFQLFFHYSESFSGSFIAGSGKIKNWLSQKGWHFKLFGGTDDFVLKKIHVGKGANAIFLHFPNGFFAVAVDEPWIPAGFFHWPDVVFQPFLERQVLRFAPKSHHGGVSMGVDERKINYKKKIIAKFPRGKVRNSNELCFSFGSIIMGAIINNLSLKTKMLSKKKNKRAGDILVALILILGFFPPANSQAKTITVDGVFSDWDEVGALVDEADFTGSSAEYSANGTTYYYNTDGSNWVTIPFANACKVNYDYMLAVDFIKMTNDNNYLYLLWERGTDFMDFRWDSGDGGGSYYVFSSAAVPATAPSGEFSGTPPCAGFVLTAPAAFDHDMVISVDKDKNGTYEYYLVINVQYPEGWNGGSYTTVGYVYEDNGNGIYDGKTVETLKTTFGDDGFEVGIATASNIGVRQEWKMSINDIFADLGINWGDSVNVRYEAHSTASDVSEPQAYTFSLGQAIKLKVNNKKKVRRSSVKINGKTAKGATVNIYVNGTDVGTVGVNKSGTFHKTVTGLQKGSNTVRIFASHASKGSKNVTKTITRK
jgi:hypothetical protein